jgi:hypothetical protein
VGALWVQCIKDNMARNDASAPAQFKWYPLMEFANWLPITYLNLPAEEKTPVEGSCLLFSSNMFTHGSMTLRQHRSHGTRVVLLADFTNKVGAEDWTLGTLAFSSKHDDKGSQLPASEAIPVAFLWCPTESARSYQAGLITFIEQFRLPLLLH